MREVNAHQMHWRQCFGERHLGAAFAALEIHSSGIPAVLSAVHASSVLTFCIGLSRRTDQGMGSYGCWRPQHEDATRGPPRLCATGQRQTRCRPESRACGLLLAAPAPNPAHPGLRLQTAASQTGYAGHPPVLSRQTLRSTPDVQ